MIVALLSSCSMTMPISGSSYSLKEADKTGYSKATLLLGFIPLGGDASVGAAASKRSKVNKTKSEDAKHLPFFLIK